jgi:hypothetical protein
MNADEIKITKRLLIFLGLPGSIAIAAFAFFLIYNLNCKDRGGLSHAFCELFSYFPAIIIGLFLVIFILSLVCNLPKKNQIVGKYAMSKKTLLRILGRSLLWTISILVFVVCTFWVCFSNGDAWIKIVLLFIDLGAIALMSFLIVNNKNRK